MVWKSIAYDTSEGVMAVEEVIAKWSNDRIQFKSYDAKLKKTKSGQETADVKSSWKFYRKFIFLSWADNSAHGQSLSNLIGIGIQPAKNGSFNALTNRKIDHWKQKLVESTYFKTTNKPIKP